MTENYYPRHTPEHLEVIREQPIPAHDVPRLTREVEGLREENEKLRAQLRSADAKVAHLLIALKEVQKGLRVSDPAVIREADDLIDQVLEEYKP